MRHPHLLRLTILIIIHIFIHATHANVEKQIFLAPKPNHPSLAPSALHNLTPTNRTHRTHLHSAFPHSAPIPGIPSTARYLLANLTPGARYEVRICWAAVQPTAFTMDVVMPDDDDDGSAVGVGVGLGNGTSSGLSWVVLAVEAEADYFSMDRGLMRDGLVVDFDVVLDEYFWGVVPGSLLPTGAHILGVAVAAGLVVWVLLWHLDGVVDAEVDLVGEQKEKRKKKIV